MKRMALLPRGQRRERVADVLEQLIRVAVRLRDEEPAAANLGLEGTAEIRLEIREHACAQHRAAEQDDALLWIVDRRSQEFELPHAEVGLRVVKESDVCGHGDVLMTDAEGDRSHDPSRVRVRCARDCVQP